jgi:hypothetical protein
MALPKPVRPEYNTTIPSTGKKIKYQPFTVKEEKILVLAAESGDNDEITNAITNILERCVTSPQDFKVEDLALFDIEYLFLKARSKSAGEKIDVRVTDPDDETCVVNHSINIDKIGIQKTEGHSTIIDLGEEMKVEMKYPDISFFAEGIDTTNINSSLALIGRCIKSIISGEEVYSRMEMGESEVEEWLEELTTEQFKKVLNFFETMPKLKHSFTLKNPNKGTEFTVNLEGLADFF